MVKAILFDMDGVLVDSEEFICLAAIEMFKEKGVNVEPEDFLPFVGAGENRYIGGVAEKYDHPLNLEQDKARKMEFNLKEICIPASSFDKTVNGLEIERKKPFPDIYLKAARLLNIHPDECLVVEDAPNGIKAAKSAGMKCLAVATSFPPEELQEADWIARDLEESQKLNII